METEVPVTEEAHARGRSHSQISLDAGDHKRLPRALSIASSCTFQQFTPPPPSPPDLPPHLPHTCLAFADQACPFTLGFFVVVVVISSTFTDYRWGRVERMAAFFEKRLHTYFFSFGVKNSLLVFITGDGPSRRTPWEAFKTLLHLRKSRL